MSIISPFLKLRHRFFSYWFLRALNILSLGNFLPVNHLRNSWRSWTDGEESEKGMKKKKKEAWERISHSPHIHPWSWAAEITNHTTQIKRLSHSFHRGNHFRNIFLGLCSPQIQLITNGLYSEEHSILTWESMRNDEKYNNFLFMVLVLKMTEVRIRSPQNPHPRWSCCRSGLQYCGS